MSRLDPKKNKSMKRAKSRNLQYGNIPYMSKLFPPVGFGALVRDGIALHVVYQGGSTSYAGGDAKAPAGDEAGLGKHFDNSWYLKIE